MAVVTAREHVTVQGLVQSGRSVLIAFHWRQRGQRLLEGSVNGREMSSQVSRVAYTARNQAAGDALVVRQTIATCIGHELGG